HAPMKPPKPCLPVRAAPSSQKVTASSSNENAAPRKNRRGRIPRVHQATGTAEAGVRIGPATFRGGRESQTAFRRAMPARFRRKRDQSRAWTPSPQHLSRFPIAESKLPFACVPSHTHSKQERLDYFLRRPRITSSVPASNASALPADAGSISGVAAIAATPAPMPNNMIESTFRITFFLRYECLNVLSSVASGVTAVNIIKNKNFN